MPIEDFLEREVDFQAISESARELGFKRAGMLARRLKNVLEMVGIRTYHDFVYAHLRRKSWTHRGVYTEISNYKYIGKRAMAALKRHMKSIEMDYFD